ncbi:hypothetical protein EJB05_38875 [Eragrostis curvula]|uniref:Uncharacterized protein n=1 Tax=Eragrostis curvula TaxID=38414 RepID=A0A5J9TW04_9POAL|nr:hypothetical protein EJB05_38875 [Eragrostis curvula]
MLTPFLPIMNHVVDVVSNSSSTSKTSETDVKDCHRPNTSDISMSSRLSLPSGISQSKQCTRFASISCTVTIPKFIPAQILRPVPKGRNWVRVRRQSLASKTL